MADDAELMRRHASGDTEAFGELVLRHRDRLWAVALRTLGDREEAADALQDALLSAYRSAGSFRGESQVSTWLHRIVVNACIDRARRRAARPTTPLGAQVVEVAAPGDAIAAADLRSDLAAALAALPVEQAAALVLVDVQGYSMEDAAAVLGVAAGTVKSRCSRGRVRLAVALGHLRPGRNPEPADAVQPATDTESEREVQAP